ncbi:ImmA/IrrE family metallo-endopeptidase [Oscillospiraceae bacterium OttesenSCG-928-G22]|nr:ImmA/IrrE family metallo-endopeptidase [Oscillospiraceae bacterium OttesenSCG-928-G22]
MESIHDKVERLCKTHGTRDPYLLCDALDIVVIVCGLPKTVYGFYQYMKRNHIIYLNAALSDTRRRLVCAHELGHAVLHRDMGATFLEAEGREVVGRLEREAEIFCLCLLKGEHLGDCEVDGVPLETLSAVSDLHKKLEDTTLRSPRAGYR